MVWSALNVAILPHFRAWIKPASREAPMRSYENPIWVVVALVLGLPNIPWFFQGRTAARHCLRPKGRRQNPSPQGGETPVSASFTLFEPDPQKLLPSLLRHFLEMVVYQQLLESFTSEQGARMVAMQDATDNALDIAQELLLEYNKERQEKITNEILDIGGSAFTYSYEQ